MVTEQSRYGYGNGRESKDLLYFDVKIYILTIKIDFGMEGGMDSGMDGWMDGGLDGGLDGGWTLG